MNPQIALLIDKMQAAWECRDWETYTVLLAEYEAVTQ